MVSPTPDLRSIDPTAVAVFEVRPGLWNLRIPLVWPGISHVNVIVLSGAEGGITLVDCGTAGDPTCWDALVTALAETGHGIAEITDLVITHAHSDHFGLATRVVAESGCTMWMHPAHEAFTDSALEPERIHAARERRARAEGVPEDVLDQYADTGEETDFALAPLPPFIELHSGMQIPSKLGSWGILETPGHSPSACASTSRSSTCSSSATSSRASSLPWYDYGYTADPVAELTASLALVEGLDDADLAFPATAALSRASQTSSRCTRPRSSSDSSSSRPRLRGSRARRTRSGCGRSGRPRRRWPRSGACRKPWRACATCASRAASPGRSSRPASSAAAPAGDTARR